MSIFLNFIGLIISYFFQVSYRSNLSNKLLQVHWAGNWSASKIINYLTLIFAISLTLIVPISGSANAPVYGASSALIALLLIRFITEVSLINKTRNSRSIFQIYFEALIIMAMFLMIYLSFGTTSINSVMMLTFGTSSISLVSKISKINSFFLLLIVILRLRDFDNILNEKKRTQVLLGLIWVHLLKIIIIMLNFEGAVPFAWLEIFFRESITINYISAAVSFLVKYILLEVLIKLIGFSVPRKTARITLMRHEKIILLITSLLLTVQIWLKY